MANYLITGSRNNTPHITSMDDASLNAGIFGDGVFILNRGEKLRAEMTTPNNCRIYDGDLVAQGRHIRLDASTYADLTINNGAAGMKRNDLVVAHYEYDVETAVESVDFIVIEGTPSASDPVDPEYTEGNIFDGDLVVDFPIYRITLDGLTVGTPVRLAEKASSLDFIGDAKLLNIALPVGESITFSATSATAMLWNSTTVWLNCGFRSGTVSRLNEGSSGSNIVTSASGTTYTITNNSGVYLRGFVVMSA